MARKVQILLKERNTIFRSDNRQNILLPCYRHDRQNSLEQLGEVVLSQSRLEDFKYHSIIMCEGKTKREIDRRIRVASAVLCPPTPPPFTQLISAIQLCLNSICHSPSYCFNLTHPTFQIPFFHPIASSKHCSVIDIYNIVLKSKPTTCLKEN